MCTGHCGACPMCILKSYSLDELKVRITNAIDEISEQQLNNVFKEVESHFEQCVLNDVGYGEG
jgi:hypothetical protein